MSSGANRTLEWMLALVILLGMSGCTKLTALDVGQSDLADGRKMRVKFQDGGTLTGRLVPGNPVRYASNDSLFVAEVAAIDEESVELSRRVLLADLHDWSSLMRVAESSEALADRPELGNLILVRDDVTALSLVEWDQRRIVSESVFWIAAALALGFAATQ